MSSTNSEPIQISISLDNLKELFKEKIYSLGYAKRVDECVADVSFGALQNDTIPVHFWIETNRDPDEVILERKEVLVEYKNGKKQD
ncbi:MAG: hypothetical protein KGI25_08330 [Thaumarchaeota archaeon]|nr:hypothetical protein [Nitrososphaerota archaeon]